MDPETAKTLMESKDVQVFVAYASSEMEKLNTVRDLDTTTMINVKDVGIEVKARKLAYEKVADILEPLLNVQERSSSFNNQEYNV